MDFDFESDDDYEVKPAVRAHSFFNHPKAIGFTDEDHMELHISDWEDDDFINYFKPKPKAKKNKKTKKGGSKRIKRIEQYFQWDSLKEKQRDAYYEFVKMAKQEWNNNGYTDETVEKHVLNRVHLMRFCIAREFKLDKAMALWSKWVQWRLEYQPHKITKADAFGISSNSSIKESQASDTTFNKCFYLWKENLNGNPCIIISPGATTETYEPEILWKTVSYVMEKACRKADRNGTTQICVIFDRKGMTNNTDKKWIPLYKELVTIIQDYYPERLAQAYVLGMNWLARLVYTIVKPFIAKKTRNKVVILKNVEGLQQYFDPSNLQEIHGGTYSLPQ